MKYPIIIRDDYIVYVELYKKLFWLHTDVFRWTATVKKRWEKDVDNLQVAMEEDLYAIIDNNPKLEKFARTVGFVFRGMATHTQGHPVKIMVRSQ